VLLLAHGVKHGLRAAQLRILCLRRRCTGEKQKREQAELWHANLLFDSDAGSNGSAGSSHEVRQRQRAGVRKKAELIRLGLNFLKLQRMLQWD
jgi:hypothetical protein